MKTEIGSHEEKTGIQEEIFRDMSDGILYVDLKGVIRLVNPAAERILDAHSSDLIGKGFARYFFQEKDYPENDAFIQMVVGAIYDRSQTHRGVVSYFTGEESTGCIRRPDGAGPSVQAIDAG